MNKNNEVSNENNILSNVRESFKQPILYLKQVPNADKINDIIKENANILLHNAPIEASTHINDSLFNKMIRNEDEGLIDAITSQNNSLNYNQCYIAVREFCNYIIQNTIISFCTMLDFTGNMYKSIIDYLPIKTYVAESLNNGDIYTIIDNFIFNNKQNSFDKLMNCTDDESFKYISERISSYNIIIISQMNQIIYTRLCEACNKALIEVLLGTRVSPNKSYVVDKACEYFNIKNNGIQTVHEVYYRLNTDLVNKIDRLMEIVVCPMNYNTFNLKMFSNLFYIFRINTKKFDNKYSIDSRENYDE